MSYLLLDEKKMRILEEGLKSQGFTLGFATATEEEINEYHDYYSLYETEDFLAVFDVDSEDESTFFYLLNKKNNREIRKAIKEMNLMSLPMSHNRKKVFEVLNAYLADNVKDRETERKQSE